MSVFFGRRFQVGGCRFQAPPLASEQVDFPERVESEFEQIVADAGREPRKRIFGALRARRRVDAREQLGTGAPALSPRLVDASQRQLEIQVTRQGLVHQAVQHGITETFPPGLQSFRIDRREISVLIFSGLPPSRSHRHGLPVIRSHGAPDQADHHGQATDLSPHRRVL